MKKCTKCNENKDIKDFYIDKNNDKPMSRCKKCFLSKKKETYIPKERKGKIPQTQIQIGSTFGELKCVEFKKYKDSKQYEKGLWLCICSCGLSIEIEQYRLLNNTVKSCGCLRSRKSGSKNNNWKGYEEISSVYFNSIKRHAETRGLVFEISIKYIWNLFIKQKRLCYLSGIPLNILNESKRKNSRTASLDRINSSFGYVEGNVQWIHKDINIMKRDFNEDYFVDLCDKISKNKLKGD